MSRNALKRAIVAASGLLLATSCNLMRPVSMMTGTGVSNGTNGMMVPAVTGTPVSTPAPYTAPGGMMTGGGLFGY